MLPSVYVVISVCPCACISFFGIGSGVAMADAKAQHAGAAKGAPNKNWIEEYDLYALSRLSSFPWQ